MGRPFKYTRSKVFSVRFDDELLNLIKDLASMQTLKTGKVVSASDLIYGACAYIYQDNNRMREVFLRKRSPVKNRLPESS